MIYLDSSVALAHFLAEARRPPASLWNQPLVSSRLLHYEVWNRLNARGLQGAGRAEAARLIAHVDMVELSPAVLGRALEPFPLPVRTLDALHLASMDFLRNLGQEIEFASYDERLTRVAEALGFKAIPL